MEARVTGGAVNNLRNSHYRPKRALFRIKLPLRDIRLGAGDRSRGRRRIERRTRKKKRRRRRRRNCAWGSDPETGQGQFVSEPVKTLWISALKEVAVPNEEQEIRARPPLRTSEAKALIRVVSEAMRLLAGVNCPPNY